MVFLIIELVGGFIYRWGLWSWKMGKAIPSLYYGRFESLTICQYFAYRTILKTHKGKQRLRSSKIHSLTFFDPTSVVAEGL